MLTLFPRIRPNPPAPPPSAPAAKDIAAHQASKMDRPLAPPAEQPTSAVIPEVSATTYPAAAGQTVVTTAAVATAEMADAAIATASGTQVLLATQEPSSIGITSHGNGSIDSQLISVFTEAFAASTSSSAAEQKPTSNPFIVEITCVPTPLDATEAPAATAQREVAVAEPEPGLAQNESATLESIPLASATGEPAAVESVAAPAQTVETADPAASNEAPSKAFASKAVLPPDVAQSMRREEIVPPDSPDENASATASILDAKPVQLTMAATTIFDELDILHEVAETNAALAATSEENKQSITEPRVALDAVIEATALTAEGNHEQAVIEPVADEVAPPKAQQDATPQEASAPEPTVEPVREPVADSVGEQVSAASEPPIAPSQIEQGELHPELVALDTSMTQEAATQPDFSAKAAATAHVTDVAQPEVDRAFEEAATDFSAMTEGDVVTAEAYSLAPSSETFTAPELAGSSVEMPEAPADVAETISEEAALPEAATAAMPAVEKAAVSPAADKPAVAPRAIALPRKPPRSKASFFELQRIPEPEAMDDSEEVEAYSSAAAQAHLDAIDDTFVAHAQLLVNGRERGRALDIGTGPGQIVIKLGARLTRWKFVGADRSAVMIEKARERLADAPEVAGRIDFRIADGNSLEFPAGTFDLVICNSVLHHMAEPQKLFAEIARVVKPGGAILLRDLVRPPRFSYASHIRKNAKHYQGEMKRLYVASVQAAYTEEELQKMLAVSPLRDVRIFRHAKTHIGFERPLTKAVLQK